MRIETYNQVQQLYRANKTVKTGKTEKGSFSDQLHISDMGKDIQSVKQAMAVRIASVTVVLNSQLQPAKVT